MAGILFAWARHIVVRAATLVFGAGLVGCGNGGNGGAPSEVLPAGAALTVVQVRPVQGDTNVEPRSAISVMFSETLDVASVEQDSLVVRGPWNRASGLVSVQGATLTFTPTSPLVRGTQYKVEVSSDVRSVNGARPIAGHVGRFVVTDGRWVSAPIELGFNVASSRVSLGQDSLGHVIAAWLASPAPEAFRVNVARRTPSGWTNAVIQDVGPSLQGAGLARVALGVSPSGSAVAAWGYTVAAGPGVVVPGAPPSEAGVWVAVMSAGGQWVPPFQLQASDSLSSSSRIEVALDATGNAVVAWTLGRIGTPPCVGPEPQELWSARFQPASGWAEPERVHRWDRCADVDNYDWQMGCSESGRCILIERHGSPGTFAGTLRQYVDGQGWLFPQPFLVKQSELILFALAFSTRDVVYLLARTGGVLVGQESSLVLYEISADGSILGAFRANDGAGVDWGRVRVRGNGNVGIAWTVSSVSGAWSAFRVPEGGWTSPLPIPVESPAALSNADFEMDSEGNALFIRVVDWPAGVNSMSAYRYTPSAGWSAAYRIKSVNSVALLLAPSVSISDRGEATVAWFTELAAGPSETDRRAAFWTFE